MEVFLNWKFQGNSRKKRPPMEFVDERSFVHSRAETLLPFPGTRQESICGLLVNADGVGAGLWKANGKPSDKFV